MTFKHRILCLCLAALLAGCLPAPATPTALDPTPTLPPGVTPTASLPPTETVAPTPTPGVRIAIADQALFDGDYSLAQTEYQAAYSSSSDPVLQAAALWSLGLTDMRAGNTGKALDDFTRLIAEFPASPNRARAHFLRGEMLVDLERYAEAVEAYSAYQALQPGVIDVYLFERRADAYTALDDHASAITDYQAAINSPHIGDNTALQIKLARAYEYSGDAVTALGMYDAISASAPNDYVRAQMDLYAGNLHLALGEVDLGYARFLHSVEAYPLAYDSYTALVALVNAGIPVNDLDRGLVDYFAGQYGYAMQAFDRYAASDPQNDGTVHYYRALTFRETGAYQQAVDTFTFFISNYPNNRYWQAAWDDKAYTQWVYLDQFEPAAQTLVDFSRTTLDASIASQALLSAGRIYERAGLLDQAVQTWSSIADSYPGSALVPQALFWAGILRYRQGQYQQALLSFQRSTLFSLEVEDLARANFWSGKVQQVLGDAGGAQASYQQAATLDPAGYYSLRAQDMLLRRDLFAPPPAYALPTDITSERASADAWLRITFGLPTGTDLSGPGWLAGEPRLLRGSELWRLGLWDEARLEFEDLRNAVSTSAEDSYRLGNALLELGLYRPAIFALRQVLTLAGMETQSETLAAPRYFNLVRYGPYYQGLVVPIAEANDLQPLFLFAHIRQESLFEGFVHSSAGARGLMQIIPATGQEIADKFGWPPGYTAEDLYRPLVSIKFGVDYLSGRRLYFGGDLVAALAAYNAGPGNADAWRALSGTDPDLFLETIRFAETRDYIRGIYENYRMYVLLYETVP